MEDRNLGLRAVLIHRGLKRGDILELVGSGLRAVLIHRGLKPGGREMR